MSWSSTRASECWGTKLSPNSSKRSRVISSMMLGSLRNHQQPKIIKLPNLRASTHSSCWFSRDRSVTRNLLSG